MVDFAHSKKFELFHLFDGVLSVHLVKYLLDN